MHNCVDGNHVWDVTGETSYSVDTGDAVWMGGHHTGRTEYHTRTDYVCRSCGAKKTVDSWDDGLGNSDCTTTVY